MPDTPKVSPDKLTDDLIDGLDRCRALLRKYRDKLATVDPKCPERTEPPERGDRTS